MIVQIIGWAGAVLVILAYVLVTSDKIEGESKLYQVLNLFGAVGVGVSVFQQKAWPALAIQVVWGVVALMALLNSVGSKKGPESALNGKGE